MLQISSTITTSSGARQGVSIGPSGTNVGEQKNALIMSDDVANPRTNRSETVNLGRNLVAVSV